MSYGATEKLNFNDTLLLIPQIIVAGGTQSEASEGLDNSPMAGFKGNEFGIPSTVSMVGKGLLATHHQWR